MDKQTVQFAVVTKNHEVVEVGRSITHSASTLHGSRNQWFDDESF